MERAVEVYDFRRPTALARDHSRVLEVAFETFARQWGTLLAANVRAGSTVVAERVTMVSYVDYAASLPASTTMVLCDMEGQEARAVIQFPTEAAFHWLKRMLGGSADGPLPDRKFTPLEQSLVKQLMADALAELHYSFGLLLAAPLTFHGFHFNSQFAQAAATDTLMIVAGLRVSVDDVGWGATIALPAEPLLNQLGTKSPSSKLEDAPAQLRCHVAAAPIVVEMSLGPVPVSPPMILDLSVGDVLSLRHPVGRPFDMMLSGRPVAGAVGVAHGSRQAGQIVSIEESTP